MFILSIKTVVPGTSVTYRVFVCVVFLAWRVKTYRGLSWLVECCFTSTETVGLLETDAQDGHLDFHTAPELDLSLVDLSVLVP